VRCFTTNLILGEGGHRIPTKFALLAAQRPL
jgi:hypothetical protein